MTAVGGQDHFRRWDSKILEIELQYLVKELDHLKRKLEERELTRWEEKRIEELRKERKLITYRINSGSLDRSQFEGI